MDEKLSYQILVSERGLADTYCVYVLYSIIEENRKNRWSKCALPEHQLIKIRRAPEVMARWDYAVKIATCEH